MINTKIRKEIEIELTEEEEMNIIRKWCKNDKRTVEVLLQHPEGYCPFPTHCKEFPICKHLSCNATNVLMAMHLGGVEMIHFNIPNKHYCKNCKHTERRNFDGYDSASWELICKDYNEGEVKMQIREDRFGTRLLQWCSGFEESEKAKEYKEEKERQKWYRYLVGNMP
jgi:hypothetical protein